MVGVSTQGAPSHCTKVHSREGCYISSQNFKHLTPTLHLSPSTPFQDNKRDMLKQTSPALREWKYTWEQDFYGWLTNRPDPKTRRNWRFHGKQILPWFQGAYLQPTGSGCRGLFNQVVKCLDSVGGHSYLPQTDCVKELEAYQQCLTAGESFKKHWNNKIRPGYRAELDARDTNHTKRTSWKQTRNLIQYWYGRSYKQASHSAQITGNKHPYFPDALYTPEAFDTRVADDNSRALLKDAVFPHTMYYRGHHPLVCCPQNSPKTKT